MRIAATGLWGIVEYAVCENGSSPAKEHIESLETKDQLKIAALFQRMADSGKIENTEKFTREKDSIWAFKSFQFRFPCFQKGRSWVVTHGFRKKRNKWPPEELKRAERIRDEHLSRRLREENDENRRK